MKNLMVIIITFVILIFSKKNINFKNYIYKNVYNTTFNFSKINKIYKKYFNSSLPFYNALPVFNEKLEYKGISKYKNGINLEVENNYLVPVLDSGIVIFKGDKEEYGKTIIIQQENGIDVWYSNLQEYDLNIYDYVKKGELLGVVNNNLYLVYMKNGEFIDYKEYF